MHPLAPLTYDHSPKPPRPTDRTLGPLDLRERYKTEFTQAPVHIPFAPTGSFNYRNGVYTGRSMTLKEQRFEQFVNAVQARHDELSDLIEWRRRKDVEEEAISVYFELGQDLQLFIQQMKTFDQQETEYQCQRRTAKLKCLYPQRFPKQLRAWKLERQERIRTQEADEREREQQRINSVAVAKFKADVQASIDPIARTKCTTNAAGSQKASQENKLKQLKPKNPRSDNQAAYSTRAGSSRQQEHQATLSDEEKRRQFGDQVRERSETSRNNSQTVSSPGAGSSRQQELKATLSDEEKRLQVQDQVRSHSGTSHDSDQIASSAAAAPSEQQGHEAMPSAGDGHLQSQEQSSPVTIHINNQSPSFAGVGLSPQSHSQDQVRIMPARAATTPLPITEAIPSVTPEMAASIPFQNQVRSSPVTIHINNQSPSFAGAGLSTESHSHDQGRVMPARATPTPPSPPTITAIQSVTPEMAAPTQAQNPLQSSPVTTRIDNQVPSFGEAGLSTESHSQDQGRMMPAGATTPPPMTTAIPSVTPVTAAAGVTTTPPPITEAISSAAAETAVAAQRAYEMEFEGPVPAANEDSFTAELAGCQPRMGICHGVHYPKDAVLVNTGPGLAKLYLGCPSVVTQSLASDIGQGLHEHQATGSGEHPSTSASSHHTSSQGSTPPSSLQSSPPKTPIMYPLNAPAMRATNTQYEEPENVALFRQLETSTYGSVRSTNRFANQESSRRDDPVVTSALQAQLQRMKARAAREEFYRDWPHQQDGYGYGQQRESQFGVERGIWGRGPWN